MDIIEKHDVECIRLNLPLIDRDALNQLPLRIIEKITQWKVSPLTRKDKKKPCNIDNANCFFIDAFYESYFIVYLVINIVTKMISLIVLNDDRYTKYFTEFHELYPDTYLTCEEYLEHLNKEPEYANRLNYWGEIFQEKNAKNNSFYT